jgi:hypothetical protein
LRSTKDEGVGFSIFPLLLQDGGDRGSSSPLVRSYRKRVFESRSVSIWLSFGRAVPSAAAGTIRSLATQTFAIRSVVNADSSVVEPFDGVAHFYLFIDPLPLMRRTGGDPLDPDAPDSTRAGSFANSAIPHHGYCLRLNRTAATRT